MSPFQRGQFLELLETRGRSNLLGRIDEDTQKYFKVLIQGAIATENLGYSYTHTPRDSLVGRVLLDIYSVYNII